MVKFETAIAVLGGLAKATPKGILVCMAVPGVNILHVKSRLQKFRLQLGIPPEVSHRGLRLSDGAPRVTEPRKRTASHATIDADSILKEVYAVRI